jgi:mannose-6-phosphate isomerase-like protein (cupin superfamily)
MTTADDTRSQVRIYRAGDAPLLEESGAVDSNFGAHEDLREIATVLSGTDCAISRLLLHQSRDEGGLSIVYLFFKPNFPLFRHMHDVDSLYVVISGTAVDFMGEETLQPGDIFSVRAGTPYYYTAGSDGVEVLEIFRDSERVSVIYTDNPDNRLELAQEAVRANIDVWRKIDMGPLFRARVASL